MGRNELVKMQFYQENTRLIAKNCHALAQCSKFFLTGEDEKPISIQYRAYQRRLNRFKESGREISREGYQKRPPYDRYTASKNYKMLKRDTLLHDIERVPIGCWVEEGLKIKGKLTELDVEIPSEIQNQLEQIEKVSTLAKELSALASAQFDSLKKLSKPKKSWFCAKPWKISFEEDIAQRFYYEIDDIQRTLENTEAMIFKFLKNPHSTGKLMKETYPFFALNSNDDHKIVDSDGDEKFHHHE